MPRVWTRAALCGAALAMGACASLEERVAPLVEAQVGLFSCPAQAGAGALREDRREADAARLASPKMGAKPSAQTYRLSVVSQAAYAMYDAFDAGQDPAAGAPDLASELGLEVEAFIFGEPGRDTERRLRRRRTSEPTLYGFTAYEAATRTRYVAFRGTLQPEEWARNIQLRQVDFPDGGRVHTGFYTIYQTLRLGEDGARGALIDQLGGLEPRAARTVFLGHSLGGALAAIAAVDARDAPWADGGAALSLTTFAAPRPGNAAFAALAAPITATRVCNVVDVVPGVPFSTRNLEYAHVGPALALSAFDYDALDNALESRGEQILCWHAMATYRFMLDPRGRRPEDSSCFRSRRTGGAS